MAGVISGDLKMDGSLKDINFFHPPFYKHALVVALRWANCAGFFFPSSTVDRLNY